MTDRFFLLREGDLATSLAPPPSRDGLADLLRRVCSGDLNVAEFCKEFEYCWNLERRPDDLDSLEKQRLKRVFDVVAWYSPYEDERDRAKGYKDEATVLSISKEVLEALTHTNA